MTGFFEESPGVKSLMRLMSYQLFWFFIIVNLAFSGVYGYAFYKAIPTDKALPQIDNNLIWFNCVVLLFCFAPKVAQKLIEMKFGIKETDEKATQTTS